ncbi:MAG: hypothetical protein RMM17_09500 [Acidobacteriota bacterium]|nr:hypothetical protein [Blastocatellia bacterium]MDW8412904.1 hypothetical protein [Acidobacteriota bacterium]
MHTVFMMTAVFFQLFFVQQPTRVLGEVIAVDVAAMQLKVKAAGGEYTVVVDESVICKRVAPEARSLEGAELITLADIRPGDRVWARNITPSEKATNLVFSRELVLMSAESIAERNRREREAWQRRSIRGEVMSVAAKNREVVLRVADGQSVTVKFKDGAELRIYPPDSTDFFSAKPVELSQLKVGTKLLARGDRSQDGTVFTAEMAVGGDIPRPTFGQVSRIDSEKGEVIVRMQDQTAVIKVDSETLVRAMPDFVLNPDRKEPVRASGKGSEESTRRMTLNPSVILELLRRMPEVKINELKTGEYVLANGPRSADGSIKAIFVVRVPVPTGFDSNVSVGDFGGAFSNLGVFQ